MLFGKKPTPQNQEFENVKKELAKALRIALGHRSITKLAYLMKMVDPKPLIDLYNGKINTLPDRKLLRKIALHSEGRLTHIFLYDIAGYSENDPEEDRTWRTWIPKRGCVYFADLGFGEDSVQGGQRPVLIIGNDIGNKNADIVLGVPISTKRKASNRLHVHVGREYGFKEDSYCLCEQIRVMSKRSFFFNGDPWQVSTLDNQKLQEVRNVLEFQLGFENVNFNSSRAFRLVNQIKLLENNIKIEKSHDLIQLMNEKLSELISYCNKYRVDHKHIMQEYDRLNNFACQAI